MFRASLFCRSAFRKNTVVFVQSQFMFNPLYLVLKVMSAHFSDGNEISRSND